MNNEIKELLDKEIKSQILDLKNLTTGSKEKSDAVGDLVQLYKLGIEDTKTELEFAERREKRIADDDHFKTEAELKRDQFNENTANRVFDERFQTDQLSEQVKDRYFRLAIAAAEIILPLIFYASWMKKGFKFEKDGTYTSTTFKNLISRFRPTKK